nr:putative dynamin-related protein 4a [Quercus suber]
MPPFQKTSPSTLNDATTPFLAIPWTASLLSHADLVIHVPDSRKVKRLPDTEDSLFADILSSDRTVQSCVSFYPNPESPSHKIREISTLLLVGNGMNGHAGILHGGIVATIIDEAMGILQSANREREFHYAKSQATPNGKPPLLGAATFTVELKVTYLKPVLTPGPILLKTRSVKREARKEWIAAEVLQEIDGKMVVCSKGEALFVQPKEKARFTFFPSPFANGIMAASTTTAKSDGYYGLGEPLMLEKIDKLFACGVGELIDLPQIVVVGDQSSGKSSVLEGLIKKPLPRDSGLCTRFATQFVFRRAAVDQISVSIIPARDASAEHTAKLKAWGKSDLKSLSSDVFVQIMDEVCYHRLLCKHAS